MTNERDPVTIEPATGDETTEAAGEKPDDEADPKATEETESKPDDKVEDTPSGAWKAFAPAPATTPGRYRLWAGQLGRVLSHEWTVVSILSVLLSIAMTWPSALHPSNTLPED